MRVVPLGTTPASPMEGARPPIHYDHVKCGVLLLAQLSQHKHEAALRKAVSRGTSL